MPSQADEEAHQLSYLQKHMANILALLGQPVEGEGEESLVSVEKKRGQRVTSGYFYLLRDGFEIIHGMK